MISHRAQRAGTVLAPGPSGGNDSPAIQAALASLPSSGATIGGIVQLQAGLYLIGTKLTIPNGAHLQGAGQIATVLRLTPTFNDTCAIQPEKQDGTQQYAFLSNLTLDANKGGGAICSLGAIDFSGVYVWSASSFIRNVTLLNSSSVGLYIGTKTGHTGSILVEGCWIAGSGSHTVYIEDSASYAVEMVTLRNCAFRDQAGGFSGIHLRGTSKLVDVRIRDCSIYQSNAAVAGTKAITADGVGQLTVENCDIFGSAFQAAGILITNVAYNSRYWFRNINNENQMNPALDDQKLGIAYTNTAIALHTSTEHGVLVNRVQNLTYGATVAIDVLKGNYCVLSPNDTNAFTISNPTNARDGDILTLEIANTSGAVMGAITWPTNFYYRDTSWVNPAAGKRRLISFRNRGGNGWAQIGPSTGDMNATTAAPLVIDASAFQGLPVGGASFDGNAGWKNGTSDGYLSAALPLPQGASVSKIEYCFHQDGVVVLSCFLYGRTAAGVSTQVQSPGVSTGVGSADQTLTLSTPGLVLAAGTSYFFTLLLRGTPSPTGAFRFLRVYP